MKVSLSDKQIRELRAKVIEKQKTLKEGEYIKLSKEALELVLIVEGNLISKHYLELRGLDLSEMEFDNIGISDADFEGSIGAKINPQTVKGKDCTGVNFKNTIITGPFTGCMMMRAKLGGSEGVKIDPQTIKDKNCSEVDFASATIIGSFDGCSIVGASFKGSKSEENEKVKVNPQAVKDRNCAKVNFEDTIVTKPFIGCKIVSASFEGSEEAKIDPQQVEGKNCLNVNFAGATIIGSFDGCYIEGASFEGSKTIKNEKVEVNPQTVKGKNCTRVNFAGTIVTGPFDYCSITEAKLKGSIGAKININRIIPSINNTDFTDAQIQFEDIDKAIERLYECRYGATKDGVSFIGMLQSIVNKRDAYYNQILDEIDKSVVSPGMQPILKPES